MNIQFDTNKSDISILEYKTEEQWNDAVKNMRTYGFVPSNEPDMYPCIALSFGGHEDQYGPYQDHYMFIYDYNILPE